MIECSAPRLQRLCEQERADFSIVIVTGAALIVPQAAARAAGSATLDIPGVGSLGADVTNSSCKGSAGSFSATVDDNKATAALTSSAARSDGYATMTLTETAAGRNQGNDRFHPHHNHKCPADHRGRENSATDDQRQICVGAAHRNRASEEDVSRGGASLVTACLTKKKS